MVGPGEVDDELDREVSEECSRFGKVERCLIFEVTDGSATPETAVRIFVSFSSIASAQKGLFSRTSPSASKSALTRYVSVRTEWSHDAQHIASWMEDSLVAEL